MHDVYDTFISNDDMNIIVKTILQVAIRMSDHG